MRLIGCYLVHTMAYLFDTDAIYHQLELVTGNTRHFERIQDLKINPILAQSRQISSR